MARTTKETEKKETTKKKTTKASTKIEATVSTEVETKEEVKVETKVAEEESDIIKQAKEYAAKKENMLKIYMKIDTPYVSEPNQFRNVSGIIKKGTLCYVEEEIDNGEKGSFWKVGRNQYINKRWEVEVL